MFAYVIRNNDDNTLFVRLGKPKWIDGWNPNYMKYMDMDIYSSETPPKLYATKKSAENRLKYLVREYKNSYSERVAYTKNLEVIEIEIKY